MRNQSRAKWIVALGLGFYAAALLLEFALGIRTGESVNWLERAIFWAFVAVPWAFFMEWFLRKYVARQAEASGAQ